MIVKILLTGFEAFGDVEENPSQVIVEQMAHAHHLPEHIDLICEILPVEYEASGKRIRELIDDHQPDAVVMTGVAASRDKISVEFWARNVITAQSPDNSGMIFDNHPINPDESIKHFLPSTLPASSMYYQLRHDDIPAEMSNNAGGYVCNYVFYSAVNYIKRKHLNNMMAGFIHIPTFDAISKVDMLKAYHLILRKVSSAQPQKHLDSSFYMNPDVEHELQQLLNKLPNNPAWCALVTVDGLLAGNVGKKINQDRVSAMVAASVALTDRISDELKNGGFTYHIVGGEKGVFYVFLLNESYLLGINWEEETSLSSIYLASKALPNAIQPILKLLA